MKKLKIKGSGSLAKILVVALLIISFVLSATRAFGASTTNSVNQNVSHSEEQSMYLYTLVLNVANPCNTNDCDSDAICDLSFAFDYKDQNGYGTNNRYTLDMSYKNGKNQNENYVKLFQRKNDNGYKTEMNVWVPGIVTKISLHLNMDGGERLNFSVDGVYVNGFRANINTDYVSSAYYDSDGTINCTLPDARIIASDGNLRDCYGALAGEKLLGLYNQNSDKYGYFTGEING